MKKTLAVYQILGGLIGVFVIIGAIIVVSTDNSIIYFFGLAQISLYLITLASGILLFQESAMAKLFVNISFLLQVFHFSVNGYLFLFRSGVFGGIIYSDNKIDLKFSIDVSSQIAIYSQEPDFIGVNILQIGIFVFFNLYFNKYFNNESKGLELM